MPGVGISLDFFDKITVPLPWVIAFCPYTNEDVIRWDVAVEPALGPSEAMIGLASKVAWAKELVTFNYCCGRGVTVHQSGYSADPRYIRIQPGCDGTHTILFRKPKAFGWWWDMYWFDPGRFWEFFGGRWMTFTWLADNAGCYREGCQNRVRPHAAAWQYSCRSPPSRSLDGAGRRRSTFRIRLWWR